MNFQKFICAGIIGLTTAVNAAALRVDSSKAAFYVGQEVMVCGPISQVTPFSKGTYLSMGPQYPKQHLTVVIWGSDEQGFNQRFGGLQAFLGKQACALGIIETYKNKLQIKISNPQFLRLMK